MPGTRVEEVCGEGTTIAGRLNGGTIQHDRPFENTPLTLTRQ